MNKLGNIGVILIGIALIIISITGAVEISMIYDLDYSEASYMSEIEANRVPIY